MFKRKNKMGENEAVISNGDKDTALLLLIDKKIPNLRAYIHSRGIKVDEIYYDINEAKIGMFIQSGYCRLVVVETGLGVFTTTVMRAELSDLLGICDGVEKKITVFYTDSIIKSENTEGRRNKDVDWYKFKTTAETLDIIKAYNEKYVTDKELQEEVLESYEQVMKFTGDKVELKEDYNEVKANREGDPYDKLVGIVRNSINNEKVYAISRDRKHNKKDTEVNIDCDSLPIYDVAY